MYPSQTYLPQPSQYKYMHGYSPLTKSAKPSKTLNLKFNNFKDLGFDFESLFSTSIYDKLP